MLNSVHLLGRLAQDPELRYTQTGTAVTSFDLAVPVPSKDNNTPPEYLPIVCWEKTAEFVAQYLRKGRQIVVDGRLTTRKRTDNEGKTRKFVEVTASRIMFADSPKENKEEDQPAGIDGGNYTPAAIDDDLPF